MKKIFILMGLLFTAGSFAAPPKQSFTATPEKMMKEITKFGADRNGSKGTQGACRNLRGYPLVEGYYHSPDEMALIKITNFHNDIVGDVYLSSRIKVHGTGSKSYAIRTDLQLTGDSDVERLLCKKGYNLVYNKGGEIAMNWKLLNKGAAIKLATKEVTRSWESRPASRRRMGHTYDHGGYDSAKDPYNMGPPKIRREIKRNPGSGFYKDLSRRINNPYRYRDSTRNCQRVRTGMMSRVKCR